jgi:hypothetical protein
MGGPLGRAAAKTPIGLRREKGLLGNRKKHRQVNKQESYERKYNFNTPNDMQNDVKFHKHAEKKIHP